MKTKWMMAGLVAVLALGAGSVMAMGHRDRPDLATMDTDGDGVLSLEEMTAFAQTRAAERAVNMFARLDTNGDGRIDADEFAAAQARRGDGHGQRAHD